MLVFANGIEVKACVVSENVYRVCVINFFGGEFSRIESNSAGIRILDIGSNSCTLVVGYIM